MEAAEEKRGPGFPRLEDEDNVPVAVSLRGWGERIEREEETQSAVPHSEGAAFIKAVLSLSLQNRLATSGGPSQALDFSRALQGWLLLLF